MPHIALTPVGWRDKLPTLPDLIVTSITSSPASPSAGDHVVFSATVKNVGESATPNGVGIGILFSVDGAPTNWTTDNTPLAVGATRVLTATNGTSGGNYWVATSGNHAVQANVNNTLAVAEVDVTNNVLSSSFNVATPVTPPPPSGTITHGAQINATNVGPAAFGYTTLVAATAQTLTTTTNPNTVPWVKVLTAPRVINLPDGTTYTIPAGDWLVEGYKFSSGFSIYRSGVHFLGCEFSCTAPTGWALFPRNGGYTRFSFIGGKIHAPSATGQLQYGINASGDYSNISVLFSELYYVADAILINGNIQDVRGNYGHDLIDYNANHNDFYQAHGGQQHISITLNRWENQLTQTSCVALFQDNPAGGNHYNDVTVSKNFMAGGGYCIYGGAGGASDPKDSITAMTFDSNKFSTMFFPGGGAANNPAVRNEFNATEETWTNNTWADGPNAGQPA